MIGVEEEWVSPKELAEAWGVPEKTLSQWRYLRKGPRYFKLGRHIRYRQSDVDAWLVTQEGPNNETNSQTIRIDKGAVRVEVRR